MGLRPVAFHRRQAASRRRMRQLQQDRQHLLALPEGEEPVMAMCQRCRGSGYVIKDKGEVYTDAKGRQQTRTVQVPQPCDSCINGRVPDGR